MLLQVEPAQGLQNTCWRAGLPRFSVFHINHVRGLLGLDVQLLRQSARRSFYPDGLSLLRIAGKENIERRPSLVSQATSRSHRTKHVVTLQESHFGTHLINRYRLTGYRAILRRRYGRVGTVLLNHDLHSRDIILRRPEPSDQSCEDKHAAKTNNHDAAVTEQRRQHVPQG